MKKCYIIRLGHKGAIADVAELGDEHWLTRINVPLEYRRLGYGERLLKQVCAEADRCGITLLLGIEPSGDATEAVLTAWYMKHGFKYKSDDDNIVMERCPVANQAGTRSSTHRLEPIK